MTIKKLLIANRGEIACRIIKTAKKMGIETVAVYSEIDEQALHVITADEAYCIGPAPSQSSYLNGQKIIAIAKESGANAIHPGYGFLAEDAEFATACKKAGLIFVGPPVSAIKIMGNKNKALIQMNEAGVPTTPGYHGTKQDIATLSTAAEEIGYPILLKASAGGGGKGIRLVSHPDELATQLKSAQREAKASFSSDQIFIEKYIAKARHVELQVFFDQEGHGVHLFDRDCSIQRRHQKIIEEAQAPNLSASVRKAMAKTALAAGKAIQYVGAGTIEFLVDENGNFYFMEMNTRLQVEHPVTEMITGIDLVQWQLQIASGESLPLSQDQIQAKGHAFEARICAENPAANFIPSTGVVSYFSMPASSETTRIDTGIQQNDNISIYYDSLIAKLIVWDKDRSQALKKLEEKLAETYIVGVETNVTLLSRICRNADFQAGKISTQLINENQSLLSEDETLPNTILALACIAELNQQQNEAMDLAKNSADFNSPWFQRDAWRLNGDYQTMIKLWFNNKRIITTLILQDGGYLFQLGDEKYTIEFEWETEQKLTIHFNQQRVTATIITSDQELHIFQNGEHYRVWRKNPLSDQYYLSSTENKLTAPMPGIIVDILTKPGEKVKKGDRLVILEAMKMEHTLFAPFDGQIKQIFYNTGDSLTEGVKLLEFE